MRVNTRPRHKNAPRIAEKSAPGFLQWIRGRNCCLRCSALHLKYPDFKADAAADYLWRYWPGLAQWERKQDG